MKRNIVCKYCKKTFIDKSHKKKPRAYCSLKCLSAAQGWGEKYKLSCKMCGNIFYVNKARYKNAKYCSRSCACKFQIGHTPWNKGISCYNGESHPNWKGGITKNHHGYVYVYSPNHPHKTIFNKMRRSRLVMEKHLGRLLKKEEVVHHINHIKDDDRIENLMLYSSHSKHMKNHK